MAYDARLAERVRAALAGTPGIDELRMFGGLCFTLRGNMCCGVVGGDLVVRLGAERQKRALAQPHVRPMDFTGRPLGGFVYVGPGGLATAAALKRWVGLGVERSASLPPKAARPRAARVRRPSVPARRGSRRAPGRAATTRR